MSSKQFIAVMLVINFITIQGMRKSTPAIRRVLSGFMPQRAKVVHQRQASATQAPCDAIDIPYEPKDMLELTTNYAELAEQALMDREDDAFQKFLAKITDETVRRNLLEKKELLTNHRERAERALLEGDRRTFTTQLALIKDEQSCTDLRRRWNNSQERSVTDGSGKSDSRLLYLRRSSSKQQTDS